MSRLIWMVLSFLPLYGTHFECHEDEYVGQAVEMFGATIGKTKEEFSFRVENRMEILRVIENLFKDIAFPMNQQEPCIFLTCYVNGMNVFKQEFDEALSQIQAKMMGKAPIIGLFNVTNDFLKGALRIAFERAGRPSISKVALENFLATAFEYFSRLHPRFLILMIVHSEGGLLLDQAIKGLGEWEKEMAKRHLLIRTFGSIQTIPADRAGDVLNIYSKKDLAAFPYVKEQIAQLTHIYGPIEKIPSDRVVELLNMDASADRHPSFSRHFFHFLDPLGLDHRKNAADHAFLGKTYQTALNHEIQKLLGKYGTIQE